VTEPVELHPVFSATELEACARRELSKRNYIYPRAVAIGKMRQVEATREIAMMRAIAEHYAELAKKERLL
jgi:hypothetical protein